MDGGPGVYFVTIIGSRGVPEDRIVSKERGVITITT